MTVLEKYYAALDQQAAQQQRLAAAAQENNNEREQSLHLMQASMCGDMLKQLGRVQHEGLRPDVLEQLLASLARQEAEQNKLDDPDSADRTRIKADLVRWANTLLKELENGDAE